MTTKELKDFFNMYKFGGELYDRFNNSKEIYDYKDNEFARKTVVTPKGEQISRPLSLMELFLTQEKRGINPLPKPEPITHKAFKGVI